MKGRPREHEGKPVDGIDETKHHGVNANGKSSGFYLTYRDFSQAAGNSTFSNFRPFENDQYPIVPSGDLSGRKLMGADLNRGPLAGWAQRFNVT